LEGGDGTRVGGSDVENIRGFIQVEEDLFCSGQPTEAELGLVQQSGVRLVINLAMQDSDFALPDERAVVEGLGMEFLHIAVPFSAPTLEHFLRFEGALLARRGQRALAHCALNWRASSFVALFAERRLGWTRDRADLLRRSLWCPNETWDAWARELRTYHAAPLGQGNT